MVKVLARSILPMLAFCDARWITHNHVNGTGGQRPGDAAPYQTLPIRRIGAYTICSAPGANRGTQRRSVSPSQPDVNGLWRSSMSTLFRALPVHQPSINVLRLLTAVANDIFPNDLRLIVKQVWMRNCSVIEQDFSFGVEEYVARVSQSDSMLLIAGD